MKKRKVTAAVLAAATVASSVYASASSLGLGVDDSLLMDDTVEITTDVGETENVEVSDLDTEEVNDLALWPIEVETGTGVSIVTGADTAESSEELNMQVLGFNTLDDSAELRLYFWNYDGDLPEDKSIWKDVLIYPDLDAQVVTDASSIPVTLTVGDGESQTDAYFLQNNDDSGNITDRYVSVELPAGASAEFDVPVRSDSPDDLLVVPVVSAISNDGTLSEAYFDPVRLYWTEAETEMTEPGTEMTEPETEMTEPGTEMTEPETEMTESETEITEPGTEMMESETEMIEPGTEMTEPESETEIATETEMESETEAATEMESESETEAITEMETESETEAATETEMESETETSSEIESESEMEAVTETEMESESESETEVADVSDLNPDDFVTARLVVLTDIPDIIQEPDYVIANYGNIYLIQYETVEQAMQAYMYYKDHAEAVEPDALIETASEPNGEAGLPSDLIIPDEVTGEAGVPVEEAGSENEAADIEADGEAGLPSDLVIPDMEADLSDEELIIPEGENFIPESETESAVPDGTAPVEITNIEVTDDQNPIARLSEQEVSTPALGAEKVIALIDTGVSEGPNIIDRVSMIDDSLSGMAHGDSMVNAIVSQNPDAQILSIRAMGDDGYGTISSIIAAMEYAMEQDVDLINLSLYAKKTLVNTVLEAKIQEAVDKGITVVGAAGNDGSDVSGYVPGSVECAWVIGAAGEGGYRLSTSNYGATVDYFVRAGSTSEAAALFTGYVSLHGLEELDGFELISSGLTPPSSGEGEEGSDIIISTEDGMLDPVMENYVMDHADSKYTSVDKIEVVGILPVKQTLADASMLTDESNLDTFNCTDEILAFVGQIESFTAVYNLSDESAYYVAFADTMFKDKTSKAADVAMTYNNDAGCNIKYHYDYDTGIVYIPKHVYVMEDAHVVDAVKIQILQKMYGEDVFQVASTVTATSNDSEETFASSVTGDAFEFTTNIKVEKNLDIDTMTVVVNGCPVPKDYYIYDPVSGNMGFYLSTAAIQNISIRSNGRDYDQVAPAATYANMESINNAAHPALIDLDAFTIDTTWRGTIDAYYHANQASGNLGDSGYRINGTQQPTTSSMIQYITGYIKDASDITSNNASGNLVETPENEGMWSFDLTTTKLTKKNTSANKDNPEKVTRDPIRWKDLDYKENGRLVVRTYCSHISDPDRNYGGDPNAQGGIGKKKYEEMKAAYPELFKNLDIREEGKYVKINFLLRPMKIKKNADGSGYIVFGFLGQRDGTQNGVSIIKLLVEGGSHIRIKKVNESGSWDNSLMGAQFTLYNSKGSALETITISGSGYHKFTYNCEQGETYTVKETKVPAGKQKAADIKVKIGKGDNYKQTYSYDVKNINSTGYIQVEKRDSNTGTTTSTPGFNMNGAVYGIYSGSTLVQTITIQNGRGTSGALNVGTYTVKEISAPNGYSIDPNTYTAVVTAGHTTSTPCKVVSTDTPNPAYVKVTKKSTAPADILALSNYSVQGAQFTVYKDAACSQAVGTLTTDANGNTPALTLPFGTSGTTTYYVKETKAPMGHKLNTAVSSFSVSLPADAGKTKQITISDDPEFTTPKAFVEKLSSKGNPVEKVIFRVKYYDSTWADESKMKKTWYLWSDDKGQVYFDNGHKVTGRPEYVGDPFYYWNNQIVVPKGYMTIQEIEAPAEYIIDDTVYAWDTKLPNMTVKRIYNTISPCEIKLKKYKSDGTTPLSGVKFELEFIKADQELTSAAKNYKPLLQEGEKITATTNAAGEVAFPNLDQGDYKITEVETVSGQTLLKDPINVHLPMEMTQEEADAYDNVDYSKGKFDEGYTNKWFFYGCTFEVTNSATFHIPTTGGGGVWKYGYMGMAVMATIGAGMIIYERKRRKK